MTLCKESFKVCMMMATINRVYSKHSYFKHKNHAEYFVIRRMAKNCPAHALEEYTGASIIWEI